MLAVFETEFQIEYKLRNIHHSLYDDFFQALMWWYKDYIQYTQDDPPNIDALIDEEGQPHSYLQTIYDLTAVTMTIEIDWEEDSDTRDWTEGEKLDCVYEILSSNFEDFLRNLRHDIKLVFDAFQIFYAEGFTTVTLENGDTWFMDEHHHNSPLQEVW